MICFVAFRECSEIFGGAGKHVSRGGGQKVLSSTSERGTIMFSIVRGESKNLAKLVV